MKNNPYIKSNSYGRLWIETKDFFKQPEIINFIRKALNSKLVKEINEKNRRLR